jgi:hypothetical protein
LVGLAPFNRDSGRWRGLRRIGSMPSPAIEHRTHLLPLLLHDS